MASMLIAQLSDPHVYPPEAGAGGGVRMGGVDTAERLRRAVAHVNALPQAADIVLVTGDLGYDGTDEEYALLRPILDRLDAPYFVIPGNHDERGAFRRAFADHAYLPADGEFLHYVLEDYPLRLIGLDTVRPGHLGGAMCRERRAWLEARLDEAPERPTIIFMHHPPFAIGMLMMDAMRCQGGRKMGEIVARHKQIERILCGHVHRPAHIRWCGTTASTAPSTAAQLGLDFGPLRRPRWTDEPPACLLHLWRKRTGLVTHTELIGEY